MANWVELQEKLVDKQVAKRAKYGIHFDNGDGQVLAHFSGKPAHYLDGGLWKPIDTKLLALGDGYYGCPHSPVKVHPNGNVAVVGSAYTQTVALPSAQAGVIDGDCMVRKFSFGEQRLWITEDGFRSEITLNRIPTLTEARKLVPTEAGILPKEYAKSLTTATDATGKVHVFTTLTAFRTWLASAQFPVVIDPDFVTGSDDKWIYGQSNGNYTAAHTTSTGEGATSSTNRLGQLIESVTYFSVNRLYFPFDTSSIGAGSTVTQANLKLTVFQDFSDTDFDIVIMKQNWASGTREEHYDGCLTGTPDDNILRNTSGISGNTTYTSGNLSTTWVSKDGTTYYSVISSRDVAGTQPSGNEFVNIYMQAIGTAGYRPVLTVLYSSGSLLRINMNAQMQALSGGING